MSQFKPKSLVVYRIQKALELDKLDEQLSELKYTPCGLMIWHGQDGSRHWVKMSSC